jgi:hypothetical protein
MMLNPHGSQIASTSQIACCHYLGPLSLSHFRNYVTFPSSHFSLHCGNFLIFNYHRRFFIPHLKIHFLDTFFSFIAMAFSNPVDLAAPRQPFTQEKAPQAVPSS